MDQVKKWLKEGHSLATAFKAAIAPMTVQQFSEKYERSYSQISKVINCAAAPAEEDLAALSKELGGKTTEWAMLIWEQSKPKKVAV